MAKKQTLSSHQRAYMEHFLAHVEQERSYPYCEAEVERILAQMQSEDEVIRAKAVRQICPCRMSWEVFERLRKAAKRLQKDPSPLVRANALHIEEVARMVAGFEAQMERIKELEEAADNRPDKFDKRGRKR